MKATVAMAGLLLFTSRTGFADEEGLSRTSWGRFGWWETHIQALNRNNVDGLLACNVTLDGLAGVIHARAGQQWSGGSVYLTEPLAGQARFWQIRLGQSGRAAAKLTLPRGWFFATDPHDRGLREGWAKPGFDHSRWRTMIVGPLDGGVSGAWENQGLEYDGIGWYRLDAEIPAAWQGQKVQFHCWGIDDEDQTFVNGVKIGATTLAQNPNAYQAERLYEIPPHLIRWGETNTFAIRVFDDHGFGGIADSAVELLRELPTHNPPSPTPDKPGEAPSYIQGFDWVTKRIDLGDYEMTYSLASALVRVKPKGNGLSLTFDAPVRYAAYITARGVQVAAPNNAAFYNRPRDGELAENWVLLWHGNAAGPNADLPVLLVLHGKPDCIGVEGTTVMVSAQRSSFDFGPPFGLRRFSGSDTEQWSKGLPDDVRDACRFWSRAALAYPVANKEFYTVNHDTESVVITEKYQYEIIQNDWRTKPLKIAAVPPILACLLDAGYPGKMLTPRADPGFITYYGPFAATVDSDTARFEIPIPIEDSLAALETPGGEAEMDNLTRGIATQYQRWANRDWSKMGEDDQTIPAAGDATPQTPWRTPNAAEFDAARERALLGDYAVIGIPKDHRPGAPLPKAHWNPLTASVDVPGLFVVDKRVRPGVIACLRKMARGLNASFQDETFLSGVWRVEVEPTCRKKMTCIAWYRYENVPHRLNGEAPFDFVAVSSAVAHGFFETALWTGEWDIVRRNWPRLLQACDSAWRNHDWASAACDNKDFRPNSSVDITWDHSAGVEALARCAYAIGDARTYDFLCYLRARLALSWDPTRTRLTIALRALAAEAGSIRERAVKSRIVSPADVAAGRWTPVVVEMLAPENTHALQAAIAFEPLPGAGDQPKELPVYVDDVELVRCAAGTTVLPVSPGCDAEDGAVNLKANNR